ncbi:MAG: hypothetical protein ACYCOU_03915 [Sulfobacillus sp.]
MDKYHPFYLAQFAVCEGLDQKIRTATQEVDPSWLSMEELHCRYPVVTPSVGELGCFDDNILSNILRACPMKTKHNFASTCKTLYRLSAFNRIKSILCNGSFVDTQTCARIVSAIEENDELFDLASTLDHAIERNGSNSCSNTKMEQWLTKLDGANTEQITASFGTLTTFGHLHRRQYFFRIVTGGPDISILVTLKQYIDQISWFHVKKQINVDLVS